MGINIISTVKNAEAYLREADNNKSNLQSIWQKYMIEPFWADIAKWAPFDQSFKQPACITETAVLKRQIEILSRLSTGSLHNRFLEIMKALPPADEDDIIAAVYPLCDSNKTVKERQNGVIGTSVFGNIILAVNPLADDYEKWIPFVFAHEYHHNVWGNYWYVQRQGQGLEGTLLEYMVNEGQADLFAESLFPDLIPQWNRPFDAEREEKLWERIAPMLYNTSQEEHSNVMFGNEEMGIPWCAGYSFGRKIAADFMRGNPGITFSELIKIPAGDIIKSLPDTF